MLPNFDPGLCFDELVPNYSSQLIGMCLGDRYVQIQRRSTCWYNPFCFWLSGIRGVCVSREPQELVPSNLLLREIYYLARTIDVFDLDWLKKSLELLPGVMITTDLPDALLLRVNEVTRRPVRSDSDQWFVVHKTNSDGIVMEDDPERRSVNLMCVSLLLTLNPNFRFGPLLGAKPYKDTWTFFMEWHDDLYSFWAPRRQLPKDFFEYEFSPSLEDVRSVAEQLLVHWKNDVIGLACDRYVRACFARTTDATIIELSIALEVLLLRNDPVKRKLLARRAAVALGSSAEQRGSVYQQICWLYRLRNSVAHEGKITLDTSVGSIHPTSVVQLGRRYVAELVRLCLVHPDESFRNKPQFLRVLDSMAEKIKTELDSYEDLYVKAQKHAAVGH